MYRHYLNSDTPIELFKMSCGSPYVDKTLMIRDLSKRINTNNRYICVTRPRRFGKTLNNNSPGKFVRDFAKKLEYFGLELEMINTKEFKASQINHDTGEYEKIPLSQRTKIVAGHKVQRDLYSAFAMANRRDLKTIDRQKCIDNFEKFLEIQERIINNLKARGDDLPACMGIK